MCQKVSMTLRRDLAAFVLANVACVTGIPWLPCFDVAEHSAPSSPWWNNSLQPFPWLYFMCLFWVCTIV